MNNQFPISGGVTSKFDEMSQSFTNRNSALPAYTWVAKVFSSCPPSADGDSPRRDYENRLTNVVLPGNGGTTSFKYDPFGRRIERVDTVKGSHGQ